MTDVIVISSDEADDDLNESCGTGSDDDDVILVKEIPPTKLQEITTQIKCEPGFVSPARQRPRQLIDSDDCHYGSNEVGPCLWLFENVGPMLSPEICF